MKKTSFLALLIALIVHGILALMLWTLYTETKKVQKVQKKENRIKISLKEMPKTKQKSGDIKKKIQKKETIIAPAMPKGQQLKKIVPQKLIEYKKTKPLLKPHLNTKKINKKILKPIKKIQELPPKKDLIKKKNPLSWMYEDKSNQKIKQEKKREFSGAQAGGSLEEMKKLYGSMWGKLTHGQRQYMLDNQEIMRRITQEVLTRVASVNLDYSMQVNSHNIIEFYLHPNGDMSDFKFIQKSGFFILDNTTKETIEYAYSRYPRPQEKILIRYNVYYHLSRY